MFSGTTSKSSTEITFQFMTGYQKAIAAGTSQFDWMAIYIGINPT